MRPNFIKEWQENKFKHENGVIFYVLQRFVMANGTYSSDYEDNDEGCYRWTSDCGRTQIEVSYPFPDVPTYDDRYEILNNPVRLSRRGRIEVIETIYKVNHAETLKQSWDAFTKTDKWQQYVDEQEKLEIVVDPNAIIPEMIKDWIVVHELDENGQKVIESENTHFTFNNDGTENRSEMVKFDSAVFAPIYKEQKRQLELESANKKQKNLENVSGMER
ncbi:hypothetical protein, partial [Vibrio parahaemolyticus]|uniref:hypothetical protein n=1 Tax=Vibrio parahaemolyticus TaxID=670 RepID=UPI0023605988